MKKITVKTKNLFGEDISKDLYFHLSAHELTDNLFEKIGGTKSIDAYEKYNNMTKEELDKVDKNEKQELSRMSIALVTLSYGVPSDDGLTFVKSAEMTENFKNSVLFDPAISQILRDEHSANDFIDSIIPEDIRKNVATSDQKKNYKNNNKHNYKKNTNHNRNGVK